MSLYLVVFVVALGGTLFITPLVRRLALHLDIVDIPGGRKAHRAPMPYLGGLAIYIGFMVFLLAIAVRSHSDQADVGTPLLQAIAIVAGATLMVGLGLVDDQRALPPGIKMAGQFIAAGLLVASGIHFHFNHYSYLDIPVSIVWIVGITNAFNLLDNMDGLSVGVAAIACLYFFTLALLEPHVKQFIVASMAIALGGGCLGFLFFNFNPARIFMGDAGSLFLGFMMSVLGLKININGFPNLHAVNFFVPIVVLGVPIFDTTLVTISRLRRHVSPAQGGRDHTSHRLLLLGLSVREAVMTLYLAGFLLGLCGIMLTIARPKSGYLLVGLLALAGIALIFQLEKVYRSRSAPDAPKAVAIMPGPAATPGAVETQRSISTSTH